MTNQQIWDFDAYKTYLAYATGAASPKMKRKLKNPASPSKKRILVTVEEEESEPAKKKKALAKIARSKGIELLSDVALLEEAQLKKALKRSKIETTIHQAGGLSEGADSELEVPNEPKGKSIDTSEGTSLKPRVPDVSKSDDERIEYDDEPTETDNPKTSDDEEEIQDDEFVHTPEDYVPTDNESNDVTEEEYERINEELYSDVNVSLTDVEPADKEKDDVEMTIADALIPSSSISSDYAAKFLKFDNIPPTNTEVVSMIDINVQHEVPRTSSLLIIPVSIIPEQDVINQSKTVTTTSAPTISSLISFLYPVLQQIASIPTPTTTEATTVTTVIPDSETLTALHQRITNREPLSEDILGATTQRDTRSYYPKRYWELLPKEILGATTQRDTGSYYPKRDWDVLWENGGNLGNNISG
ncbi:hypothetical protein Tco_1388968 [Tanacetum coccineum]